MLIKMAREFAQDAHKGQFRPNKARLPVFTHLQQVANIVGEHGGSEAQIAAAWLHDCVEDTIVSIEQIRSLFGSEVAEIVEGLTDDPHLSNLPTLQRKLLQAERVRTKSDTIKLNKLADQLDNMRSVAADPPTSWNRQKSLDYIVGAGVVAHRCRDVSKDLDLKFYLAYTHAMSVHMRPPR